MNADLELRVTSLADGRGYSVKKFVDYEIDCSLFTVDTAFAINLISDADTQFAPGDLAELYILGKKAATGRIEKVVRKYDKCSRGYAVYGRSIAAILLDNAVPPKFWRKHEDVNVSEIIKMLLDGIEAAFRPRLLDTITGSKIDVEITPGESYWDVLSRIVTACGFFLASMADGTLEIRRPDKMADSRVFRLESGVNIMSAEITYDETKRYMLYMVESQDATGSRSADVIDNKAVFPRAIVINPEQDGERLREYGELHRAKQIKDSMQYTYTVAGHEQDGLIWGVGGVVKLSDKISGIEGEYLITGTRFTLSKQEGQRTTVTLSPLI
jgi:prophage tail gpP-like protein